MKSHRLFLLSLSLVDTGGENIARKYSATRLKRSLKTGQAAGRIGYASGGILRAGRQTPGAGTAAPAGLRTERPRHPRVVLSIATLIPVIVRCRLAVCHQRFTRLAARRRVSRKLRQILPSR
ncbi:hypothetical protein [Burkholderia glumae]|uniref:hypothetical protein n=1 Tax=Burkholderia glumae TaxID=337 RepID=UPI0012FC084F|nr:hypothetical protein [Burkholderia glumae]MCM2494274.1 hypothetical protein [Burkholderia glumae]MCM2545221.1 hypothetical protein [Burkholderia glumae]